MDIEGDNRTAPNFALRCLFIYFFYTNVSPISFNSVAWCGDGITCFTCTHGVVLIDQTHCSIVFVVLLNSLFRYVLCSRAKVSLVSPVSVICLSCMYEHTSTSLQLYWLFIYCILIVFWLSHWLPLMISYTISISQVTSSHSIFLSHDATGFITLHTHIYDTDVSTYLCTIRYSDTVWYMIQHAARAYICNFSH